MNTPASQLLLPVLASIAACAAPQEPEAPGASERPQTSAAQAQDSIDPGQLLRHIAVLASDEFEGRGPGTKAEQLTVNYLIEQFHSLGLAPGGRNGSYVQMVPLVGFRGTPKIDLTTPAGARALSSPDECVAISRRFTTDVKAEDVPIVFVGYGVVAPEYDWDDYKGVDVAGKAILMLVNDPPVPDPDDPAALDEKVFGGRAMTYYGRWTYKYEVATAKGAAMAIIVHEAGPAGYPYEVVSGSWGRENFDIARPDDNMGRVAVESWMREDVARRLVAECGQDFDQLKARAVSRDFTPVELGASISAEITNSLRKIESRNVVARVVGSVTPDEYVLYTAHWDHLGRDPAREGDQIFNGALDNASGTAGLLEMAQAFAAMNPPPERTIVFLAVTAEEKGLLGSRYYAANPLYPLERTLACINMDGLNQWGRTSDVVSVGLGNSTLHDVLIECARAQGRTVEPDDEPEKGYFYRSDHFELAKRGVPGLHAGSGMQYLDRPAGWGQLKRDEYTTNDYHKPSDEIRPEWDLSGAVEDLQLFFQVGVELSRASVWPSWSASSEFRAVREASLR